MWDGGGDGGVASEDEEEEVLSWKEGKKSREVSKRYPKALTDANVPISTAVWCVDDIPAWMFQTASCNQGKEWHRNTRKGKSLVSWYIQHISVIASRKCQEMDLALWRFLYVRKEKLTHTHTREPNVSISFSSWIVSLLPSALKSKKKKKKKKVCSLSDRFETYSDPVTREAIQFWKWQK